MNLGERLQFLMMMIPTVLLLVAAIVTLASPAKAAEQQPNVNHHEVTATEAKVATILADVAR